MKERGMLFSPPMVRALLDRSKTQTRRILTTPAGWDIENPPCLGRITSKHPKMGKFGVFIRKGLGTDFPEADIIPCPYGQPGDRLWVRETFSGPHCMGNVPPSKWAHSSRIWYWADGNPMEGDWTIPRPSIHMPRWASRIDLEITGVRVERLQDCSEEDAISEGLWNDEKTGLLWLPCAENGKAHIDPRRAYRDLWESINGPGSWDANPWVWVIEFRRIK